MPNATVTSLVNVKVGDQSLPLRYERSCHVCRDDSRFDAERLVMEGMHYKRVLAELPQAEFSEDSLRRHVQAGHLPVKETARVFAAKEKSAEISEAVVPVARNLGRSLHFAQSVVAAVEKRVVAGDLVPGIADGIAAARLLREMEADGGATTEDLISAFTAVLALLQSELEPSAFDPLLKKIATLPAVRQLG